MTVQVEWVTICQRTRRNDDGELEMVGPGRIHVPVPSVPSEVEIPYGVGLKGFPEPGKQYTFTLGIIHPSGENPGPSLALPVVFGDRIPGDPADLERTVVFTGQIRARVLGTGIFTLDAWVDGQNYQRRFRIIETPEREFDRFRELTKNLMAVPKDEATQQ